MSLSRSTRKKPPPLHSKPGNSWPREAQDQLLEPDETRMLAGQADEPVELAGQQHEPISVLAAPRSSSMATPMPRLGMNGNGCAGSTAIGVRIAIASSLKRRCRIEIDLGQLVRLEHGHALLAQQRGQLVPAALLVGRQRGDPLRSPQLLGRCQPVGTDRRDGSCDQLPSARHPDHVELVEILVGDRQKTQPLEQWVGAVAWPPRARAR